MKLEELREASYTGNIGMMEMFKFHQIATPEQKAQMKKLLADRQTERAWSLLQSVTGVKLK
jgi:Spy/CpxP family protein refolding chaperone